MIVVQRVNDGFSFPAEAYQLGGLEGAQLMADGTLGHTQQIGQITDAQLTFKQREQDAHTGGIAKYPEQVGKVVQPVIVGHHTVQLIQIGMVVMMVAQKFFGSFGQGKSPPFVEHMSICSYVHDIPADTDCQQKNIFKNRNLPIDKSERFGIIILALSEIV